MAPRSKKINVDELLNGTWIKMADSDEEKMTFSTNNNKPDYRPGEWVEVPANYDFKAMKAIKQDEDKMKAIQNEPPVLDGCIRVRNTPPFEHQYVDIDKSYEIKAIKQDEDKPSILEEAQDLIHGNRNRDYGHPKDNHGKTASLWSTYLGVPITADDVCYMNILQKISRTKTTGIYTRDTIVDIAGYAGNVEMIHE